jgi:hypothetical protein
MLRAGGNIAFDRVLILRQDEILLYPKGYSTRPSLVFITQCHDHGSVLFWLPIISMSALFEIVPSIPERSKDAANLEAEIADLKQVIISLRAQLADMNDQMDRWQSRADRISLTASY